MQTSIPQNFKDGFRLIMLTKRRKEGGKLSKADRISKRRISRNASEFDAILQEYISLAEASPDPLRVYTSVNPRNIEKAIREFKRLQLEADYYDNISRHSFYLDVSNRWISAITAVFACIQHVLRGGIDDHDRRGDGHDTLLPGSTPPDGPRR